MPASSPARIAPITASSDSFAAPHVAAGLPRPEADHAQLRSVRSQPSRPHAAQPSARRSHEHPPMPASCARGALRLVAARTPYAPRSRSRPRATPMSKIIDKTIEEKERVVIRFAGDSGDGMQLTGDRFTSATAVLGNDLATLPDFPAEIRAPAGTVHGVSAFQIQFGSSDITTPGRPRRRPGRHEPGGAQGRPRQGDPGRHRHHQRGRVHAPQHREGGVHVRPRRRRHARRLPGLQGADDLDHGPRDRGHRDRQEGGGAREEHVRARAPVVDVRPAGRRPRSTGSSGSSAASRRSSTRTWPRSRRATTSARRPSCSRTRTW